MKNQDEKLWLIIMIGIAIMVGYSAGRFDTKQQSVVMEQYKQKAYRDSKHEHARHNQQSTVGSPSNS